MTRGQITIIKTEGGKNQILTSTEFNGDMYLSDSNWVGHGEEVIELLKEVKNVADYHFAVAKFNRDNHHYNDNKIVYPCSVEESDKMLDFTKDYFEHWFSDYVYLKNLTDHEITLTTRECDENGENERAVETTIAPNQIVVLTFGRVVLKTE